MRERQLHTAACVCLGVGEGSVPCQQQAAPPRRKGEARCRAAASRCVHRLVHRPSGRVDSIGEQEHVDRAKEAGRCEALGKVDESEGGEGPFCDVGDGLARFVATAGEGIEVRL
jgi:hypothetical protein